MSFSGRIVGMIVLGWGIAVGGVPSVCAQDNSAIPGYPASIDAYDTREVALLPAFCKYTQVFRDNVPGGADRLQAQRWQAVFGTTFHHMHHYCWGLMKTNRGTLLAPNREGRAAYLRDANGEFDYVIQRAPRDFVLLPEIIFKKGENLVRLGKAPVALIVFEEATAIKPDYWPPYAHMSDILRTQGDPARAREVLERGLAAAPDTPALKRRLAELEQPK